MYCYTNNGQSWRMVDANYQVAAGEVLFAESPTVDQLTSAFPQYPSVTANALINQQIKALEQLQSARMVREASPLINSTSTFSAQDPNFPGMTSAQALAQIEAQIVALRAQLAALN